MRNDFRPLRILTGTTAIIAGELWVACAVPAQKAKTPAGANCTIVED